jgi:hypothetical protein
MGLYVSIWCLVTRRWNWSALWFRWVKKPTPICSIMRHSKSHATRCGNSLALSIKMNILLFFPALGFIYFQAVGLLKTVNLMLIIVLVQVSLPRNLQREASRVCALVNWSIFFYFCPFWSAYIGMVSDPVSARISSWISEQGVRVQASFWIPMDSQLANDPAEHLLIVWLCQLTHRPSPLNPCLVCMD